MDLSSLPCNICIGPRIWATKILIDKPITSKDITTSNRQSVRRFSSTRGDSNLTINTSTLTPSRTIGLEVSSAKDAKDVTKSPPTSRDGSYVGRRMSMQSSEDRSQLRKMTFSIRMQYRRQKEGSKRLSSTYYHLLTSASHILDHMLGGKTERPPTKTRETNSVFDLSPVLLHQSERIIHNGRVRASQLGDDCNELLCLQIFASTVTLEALTPIQILVKVETQPTVQDAFGNTEMIRRGETVLMEGLGIARDMAHTAGWTCLEEDDSRMVEWVRDEMSIQWSPEPQPPTLLPVCATVEGLQTFTRTRTLSNNSLRSRTPSLSPYLSRTHSLTGKRREGHGLGDRRDSTLKRLQEVTETLEAHANQKLEDENHSRASKVTIAAVESTQPQKPGLKTSFGGFSSLNSSRMQGLALAEETEDHLGMALSISSLSGTTSVKEQTIPSQAQPSSFSDGVGPLDYLGMETNKQVSPKPKLSRFSIKSYQLERSNHGLSDEWTIGGKGLNTNSGLGTVTPMATTNDQVSTPPLTADISLSGTVSPLTPSPESLPVPDFLQGLCPPKPRVPVSRFSYSSGSNRFNGIGKGGDEQPSGSVQDSNIMEDDSRKGTVGTFSNTSATLKGGIGAQVAQEQADKPAEVVHDFLGESFGISHVPPFKSKFERPYKAPELSSSLPTELERAQSAPRNLGSAATKSVQFAEIGEFDDGSRMQVQRASSEPEIMTVTGSNSSLDDPSSSSSSSSQSPVSNSSKSKAHTRRSWGQGIGGNDILGIQGLSE
ncbi:hypothetical protein BGZ80_004906 [Entomortierella chlamydospora]|uniref:Uncharacterized protein n=1 Tax=Entomortierella chlamydospora TaxID=101097 RepID=A0A9P6MLS3_9FUNG|nr:hypothetical protein BGZ79_007039 [Entomortierella chlamydospora]KAG0007235.1 hypothetical protein BGZ80_004906 [Entomortierella chlamydospora]